MIFIERTIFGTTLHKTIIFAKRTNFQKKGKGDSFFDTKFKKPIIFYQTIDFFRTNLRKHNLFFTQSLFNEKTNEKDGI